MACVAAAPVRQLEAWRDPPIATDWSAKFGKVALEQYGAGADAV
jgi:hypothetical protein